MVDIADKKVAYFTGCFANYYWPQVGEATVAVLRKNDVEVTVPDQVCCALPMIAKGNIKGAQENITYNTRVLSRLVADGYTLIATCSSCSLFLKQDYPRLQITEEAKQVSQKVYYITEYLLKLHETGLLITDFQPVRQTVFYHTPCHLTAQQINSQSVKLLKLIPGISISHVSEECCGMGGAYGYEKVNYELSRNITDKLHTELAENPSDRLVTDCGGCKLQMEASTGREVEHPVMLLREAYGL